MTDRRAWCAECGGWGEWIGHKAEIGMQGYVCCPECKGEGLIAMTEQTREAEYRRALLWAFDRLRVDDGMSAREQRHTMIELGKVLTGKPSPAARYQPKEWADSARLVAHGESADKEGS